jgi:SAM-dependent methyltransferase
VKPHKRYVLKSSFEGAEAPGQLGGADNLEDDIALCPLQSIDEVFMRRLPRNGPVLEAGSGRGRWVFHLRRKGYDVRGIELAATEVSFAKSFDPSVNIVVGDVLKTPFDDHSFCAVISLGVLEHFEDGPQQALREVRRILTPDGLLFVTVPTRNLFRLVVIDRIKNLQTFVRRMRNQDLMFEEYRYSRAQFSRILTDAGYVILETAPDDFRPPKNMGLYTDSRFLQSRTARWELNAPGRVLRKILDSFSPWLSCSGTLWVCRIGREREG